jgi:hypothetical protein
MDSASYSDSQVQPSSDAPVSNEQAKFVSAGKHDQKATSKKTKAGQKDIKSTDDESIDPDDLPF